jgi:hypothetical protein
MVLSYMLRSAGRPLPTTPPHNGVQLSLPSPALFGMPQNAMHRGTFGEPQSAA